MRKPVGAPAYTVLADVEPAASGSYLDKTFEWEQKYEYRITTLTQVGSHGINTAVEGDDSRPAEVFTRDIYPPAQPAGLQAVFSSVGQKPFLDLTGAPTWERTAGPARRTAGGFLQRGPEAIHRSHLGPEFGERSRRIQRLPAGRGRSEERRVGK